MKFLLVLSLLVAFTTAVQTKEGDFLDAVDFEAILANDEQRVAIFNCLIDVTPCGDMKLKDDIVKLVQNNCANCSPGQKEKFERIMKIVHEKYEKEYKEFSKKIEAKQE